MSQEKVDRYKKEKANRKKDLAKQKQQKTLKTIGGVLASVVLILAVVFSAKLLRGDFEEQETSTYSEEYLSQIRDLFGTKSESDTTKGEQNTTKAGEQNTTKADEQATTKAQ